MGINIDYGTDYQVKIKNTYQELFYIYKKISR